jgi:hypothetical protein
MSESATSSIRFYVETKWSSIYEGMNELYAGGITSVRSCIAWPKPLTLERLVRLQASRADRCREN